MVDSISLAEPKTKKVVEMLGALGLERDVLIVDGGGEQINEGLERAARNLPRVKVLRVEGVNVYDVLKYKNLVLSRAAVSALEERLER